MSFDVDYFVIGGGSGGVRSARIAASHGAKVAIAEESRWGGTCVIRGCVPKKLLVYASEIRRTLDDAAGFGWKLGEASFDWAKLIAAKDQEISRLSAIYVDLLRKHGVAIHEGAARLVDPHTVEVGGARITAGQILIATGGKARVHPAGKPELWITSDQAFHLPALPRAVAIVGGGYIAVEFAHIFAGLGAKVTLIHHDELPLRGFDGEVRQMVRDGLGAAGIEFVVGSVHDASGVPGQELTLTLDDGRVVRCDTAMSAIGRDPNTADLGLEELGIALDERGAIEVDEWSRTSVPHIYAVGDVTGRIALTPIAIREGHALADTLFGDRPTPVQIELVPTAVFSQPPVSVVGLTEEQAAERGLDVQIFKSSFRPMRFALPGRSEKMLLKLVVDRASRRVLGLHVVGLDAPEIVQAAAIAVTMGATKDDFDRTLAIHPTSAEELVLMRG
ncbi:MAG: glutathione-disulfide reductase [Myxococcales bacterium]|nr:glutathione-disulfide reductase [Myxococcales bacterium]